MTKDAKKATSKKTPVKKTAAKKETKKVAEIKKEEKIEVIPEKKIKKEKVVDLKKKEERRKKAIKVLEKIDENRKTIYLTVGCLLVGFLIGMLVYGTKIATLKDGTQPIVSIDGLTITADDLYTDLKDKYSTNALNLVLEKIDNKVLSKMYKDDDEMEDSIKETSEYYLNMYKKNYGYTEEQFLSAYGFADMDAFYESLRLDYRRNKYYEEYVKKSVTDSEINDYYTNKVFGDIDSKHILVAISDSVKDEDAKAKAQEIIDKLNSGSTFDEVKEEYKDSITYEELGYQAFDANLEEAYMTALKGLKDNEYSKEPVKTSYGYHIIYRLGQKDKAELKDVKDRVVAAVVKEKEAADSNLYYKALFKMRENANIKFSDTKISDYYENLKKQYK